MAGLVLDVFVDTPTGNQRGPPSTSFPCAEQLHPFWVRLRSARSASPQRGEAGGKKDKLQKQVYTGREFTNEFPSLDGLEGFMTKRKYQAVQLSKEWAVTID